MKICHSAGDADHDFEEVSSMAVNAATGDNSREITNNGWLQFDDVTARYPLRIDLILKKVSFEVLPGQHVAVVGRTGSGKSSLVMSLFRMLETVQGCVYIDGEDVSKLPLSTHRARLNIIPQVNQVSKSLVAKGCVSDWLFCSVL